MKNILLLIGLFGFASILNAETWTKIEKTKSEKPEIQLIESKADYDIIKFNINSYQLKLTTTSRGNAFHIFSPETSQISEKHAPDLPMLTSSIIIPDKGKSHIEIIHSEYIELNNIDIAPSKGTIYRNQDPNDVAYVYGSEYETDNFYPNQLAETTDAYIIRDFRGQTVITYPFAYNPIQKTLRIYTDITVKVSYTNEKGINENNNSKLSHSTEFNQLYNSHFLNFSTEKYTPLEEGTPGKMLIISYGDFMDEMQDFITWKREKGIDTEIIDVAEIGNANDIKTYIADEFSTNGLDYIILVGDAAQVPTTETGDDSDNEYVFLLGDDYYADCFIGRISAETGEEVTTQINKIIEYERDYQADNLWLENAFGSASNEGGGSQGDDGESDVVHMNNIRTDLELYGYTVTHVNQDGGTNTQISSAFNAGIGLANYVGHGDVTLWYNTNYTNTNVNALTNNNKYPFIFSVACVNGDFKNNTCFAEAWLRATNNSEPTGAVAFLGSTINQAWNEPMDAQDEMNDILVESYQNNIKRTFGGIAYNGMFHMLDEYPGSSQSGMQTADTWTIFGDPSLMVRTKNPSEMTISHAEVLNVGEESFSVTCDTEDALVSITKETLGETVIIGTAYVNGGSANVDIIPFDAPGEMKITITAYNKITYQSDVLIIVPEGPYVVVDQIIIDDEAGNDNMVLNNNETILLDINLKNVGIETAYSVNVNIDSENESINITDNTENFGDLNADAESLIEGAFELAAIDGIPNQTIISMIYTITDNESHEWTSSQFIKVFAPELEVNFSSVDDSDGNNNGVMDPGETVILSFEVNNIGDNNAIAGNLNLNILDNASTSEPDKDVTSLVPDDSEFISFTVQVEDGLNSGTLMPATITYTSGLYSAQLDVNLPIGLQIETWESNDFLSYSWSNDNTFPWTVVTENPFEGTYCAKSGAITPDSEGTSTLQINLNATSDGTISFYKKVSCMEEFYGFMFDYLAFYIDGNMQAQWAGEIDWSLESYDVTTGEHSFEWTYNQSGWGNEGSNCAWLDEITLPPHDQLTAIQQTTANFEEFSFEIMPNPISSVAYFNFNLDTKAHVLIELIDINGKIIDIIYQQESNEGAYQVAYRVNHIPNGNYIIRLSKDNSIKTEQIVISK
jgi:hypothetical protein